MCSAILAKDIGEGLKGEGREGGSYRDGGLNGMMEYSSAAILFIQISLEKRMP
jgi:hypothetical protein